MGSNIQSVYDYIISLINILISKLLAFIGVSDRWISYTKVAVLIVIVAISCYIFHLLIKKLFTFIFRKIAKISSVSFFKYIVRNNLPSNLAQIIPYIILKGAIPIVFSDFKIVSKIFLKLADVYLVFIIIWVALAIIRSFSDLLREKPTFHHKPMKSYIQVIQIVFYLIGAVCIFSILTNKSATAFFATMGAASAVLLLIFKDSILGFVSSIQVSSNDVVRIGDWITMTKYGANGIVEEINLSTVKVRNYDKTITTIPTYALISDSFQNWRGMQETGGRRFNRSLIVKHSTMRFVTDEELETFKKFKGLTEYIETKQSIFKILDQSVDTSVPINKHQLTNCDLFIQYGKEYLRRHPDINPNMALLVRVLPLTNEGLPVEFYCFTTTVVWSEYETILSEIINHMICVAPYFDLTLYESSSGSDDYNVYLKELRKPTQK